MAAKNIYARRAFALIGDRRFFWVIVALLVLQAAWIALSGRYPMAFDEDFHLGIIRLYAHHLSPFWSGQPPHADAFGAVARDPSYLYHYLMSFPYRLMGLFTKDQTAQVLVLRAINIGLLAWGLVVYRRLLSKTHVSSSLVNACLLIFVLIPAVPLLAAQINYDNLFLPLVGIALLWTLKIQSVLSEHRKVAERRLLSLLILCLLTSLVKYAFLPIFVGIAIYLGIRFHQTFGSWRVAGLELWSGLRRMSGPAKLLLGSAVLLSALLFAQRYAVNIVRYHTPAPSCDQVLSEESCAAYGPWVRDRDFKLAKTGTPDPVIFVGDWFYGMWFRLFFSVDGPTSGFQTRGPLLMPAIGSIFFACVGIVATFMYRRHIVRRCDNQTLHLLAWAGLLYMAALWLDNLAAFMRTAQPVAINGRYLLPFLPAVLLVFALAFKEFCRTRASWLPSAMLSVSLICLVWGGGALTYILRSNDNWYWPNRTVRSVNDAVRKTVGPITPGYDFPYEFMGRHGT